MAVCANCGQDNPDGFRFCGSCGAAMAEAARERGAQGRHGPLRRSRGLHGPQRAHGRRGRAGHARAVPRPPARRARALRRDGREVHRRCGDGAVRRAGDARGRSRAGRSRGALDPGRDRPAERAGARPRPACPSGRQHRRGAGRSRGRRRPRGGGGVRRRRQHRRPAPVRRSGRRHPRRARRPTARRIARSPTGRPMPSSQRARPSPSPSWEAVEARARLGVDVVQRPTTPLVGRAGRDRPPPRCPAPIAGRARRPARHARRRAGDRQEPARLGALRGRRARPRLHHLAPGPLAPLRRGGDLLGARRDDRRPRPASSTRTRPTRQARSSRPPSRT